MPKKKRKPVYLNIKQQEYLKGIAGGKSSRQSALDAGYSENTANMGTEGVLRCKNVQDYLKSIQEQAPLIVQRFHDQYKKNEDKDPSSALRANENLAKILQLVVAKQEIGVTDRTKTPFMAECDRIIALRSNLTNDEQKS